MIGETYEFTDVENGREFIFISVGKNGKILKQVVFEEISIGIYNLGFGDRIDGQIEDSVISNNNDLLKIMNTVGAIIYDFFDLNPTCSIEITPVDEKRARLYHTIFKRRIQEINRIFVLEGYDSSYQWSEFKVGMSYQRFKLKKK